MSVSHMSVKNQIFKKDMNEIKKIKFSSIGEYMNYRQIHVDAIERLQKLNTENEVVIKQINRHQEYLLFIDMILNNSFFESSQELLFNGIKIDPILFPNIDVKKLYDGVKLLQLTPDGTKQLSIEFDNNPIEEPKEVVTIVNVEDSGEIVSTIKKLFKEKGGNITTVVEASLLYGKHNNKIFELVGLYELIEDLAERFPFVRKLPQVNNAGKFFLKQIKEGNSPVKAMLSLRMKMENYNILLIGQFFGWILENTFNQNQKNELYDGWNWSQYQSAINTAFRLVVNEEDLLKREQIEKDKISDTLIAKDHNRVFELMSDDFIKKYYITYVNHLKDEAKKEYLTKEGEINPKTYHRVIEECISYGSNLRRSAFAERTRKKYEENAYDKN